MLFMYNLPQCSLLRLSYIIKHTLFRFLSEHNQSYNLYASHIIQSFLSSLLAQVLHVDIIALCITHVLFMYNLPQRFLLRLSYIIKHTLFRFLSEHNLSYNIYICRTCYSIISTFLINTGIAC